MIFNTNKVPVNEVYFGKTKSIQKIESAIDHFRNKHMNQYMVYNVNSDPELIAINRMLEKEFGFGTFSLHIVNCSVANAATYPLDMRFDVKTFGKNDELLVDKTGFRFNPKADYACLLIMYTGLIFSPNFTTEEVMAAILHEIGHNFYASINRKNGVLSAIYKVLLFYDMFYCFIHSIYEVPEAIEILLHTNNSFEALTQRCERYLREHGKILIDVIEAFKLFCDAFYELMIKVSQYRRLVTFNIYYLVIALKDTLNTALNPFTYILLPIDYRNERLADNFPTMYGYGPALSSFVTKLDSAGNKNDILVNVVEKTPVIGTLYNMVGLSAQILITALDEHPEGISRCKDQIDLLNNELKKSDMDPKMRKVIKSDIDLIQREIDKSTNISKFIIDPDFARHLYNRLLYKLTGAREFKTFLLEDRHKFEEYDKTFYEQLDKSKA